MLTESAESDGGHEIAQFGARNRWSAAVERGGRGDGAAALTELARVERWGRAHADAALTSLALSTTASLYRQCGRHQTSRRFDGLALAALPRPFASTSPWSRAAALDAVTGLAADALGLAEFGVAATLLDRVAALLRTADDDDWLTAIRPRLRACWVRAELALYTNRPSDALTEALAGQEIIATVAPGHERHRIKTDLIAAAARAGAGELRTARLLAHDCRDRASALGLVPLTWAALLLIRGLGDTTTETITCLDAAHEMLVDRGMPFAHAQW
ncbi:hypothetical protein ACWDTD_05915 [Gordonia sp. NPDC003425]